ncbi:Chloride channel protein A [Trichoplax sp. H2]|nr:Chloride channel protein A [Trichoplax sp. H2]|eukprot:RDD45840.1 Chloride channel protein A [Trichoplax sp. H2]
MAHRNSDNPNVQIRNRSESTSHLADQGTGFFQWGRDLGGTDSNHKFTEHEKDLLAQYQSADYLPPYSCAYKEWLRQQPARLDWDKWLMMGIIGFVVGITGFLMHQTIGVIADLKWDRAYEYVKERNFGMAWVWLALIGIGFAIISSLLVVLFHLPAGGSGMPELIGFLNGTLIRNVFGIKTAVIKFLSCVCAVGSGLPVGPEGPMIHLGALIGGGLSQAKSSILNCILPIFGRFRNPEDERNFISAGAGAGVSAAFGAPVGGLLFTMEEVSSFWSLKHGWMTFFCCMTSTFTTDLFNSAFQGFRYTGDFGAFKSRKYILFEVKKEISLNILAFIPSLIIGMIGGLLGALFTFLNLKIARSRRRLVGRFKSTWVKNLIRVSEVTLIMTLTATMSILLPGGFGCTPYQCQNVNTTANVYQGPLCRRGDQYKIHTENEVVGYTCPVGITKNVSSQVYFTNQTYNQVASLVSVQGEEAIHRLFSRQTYLQFDIGPLATVLVLYFTLACWTAGSAVSSGLVVPMLLVGALYGRLIGRLLVVMFGVHQTGKILKYYP